MLVSSSNTQELEHQVQNELLLKLNAPTEDDAVTMGAKIGTTAAAATAAGGAPTNAIFSPTRFVPCLAPFCFCCIVLAWKWHHSQPSYRFYVFFEFRPPGKPPAGNPLLKHAILRNNALGGSVPSTPVLQGNP
jgi:hypothetical protein